MKKIPDAAVDRRFASTARLFPADEFAQIRAGHVAVVGLGGVGSWAAEALARSGVGALTLIDMDHVAESNLNRQVQALHSTLGMAKGEALAARIRDIAPDCRVVVVDQFVTPENFGDIASSVDRHVDPSGLLAVTKSSLRGLEEPVTSNPPMTTPPSLRGLEEPVAIHSTIWLDATDDLRAKKAMILWLQAQKSLSRLIVSGGAGGKTDPTRIEVTDLSETLQDPLLSTLRYDLRKHHGFPRQGRMKITVVFSRQPMVKSDDCDPSAKLACAGYGSFVTVTAVMGMAAASEALLRLRKKSS
jgi:tRNA threonylcarbamoyladenosine dehydratase